jgi:hypothetical protein
MVRNERFHFFVSLTAVTTRQRTVKGAPGITTRSVDSQRLAEKHAGKKEKHYEETN